MSKRSSILGLGSNRLSRDGFRQIPELDSTPANMRNPNDATIDIPLTAVTTQTPRRQNDGVTPAGSVFSATPPNEKTMMFSRNAGGLRRKIDTNNSNGRVLHKDGDTLTKMGAVYRKILNFSIVTRYFLYVLPLAIMIAVPIVAAFGLCGSSHVLKSSGLVCGSRSWPQNAFHSFFSFFVVSLAQEPGSISLFLRL